MTDLDKIIMEQVAKNNKLLEEHLKNAFRKKFNADFETLIKAIPQDFRCEHQDMDKRYLWCDKVFLIEHSQWEYTKDKVTLTTTLEYI